MPTFSTLEAWTRSQVQELMQSVLEEEVTHALGRASLPTAGVAGCTQWRPSTLTAYPTRPLYTALRPVRPHSPPDLPAPRAPPRTAHPFEPLDVDGDVSSCPARSACTGVLIVSINLTNGRGSPPFGGEDGGVVDPDEAGNRRRPGPALVLAAVQLEALTADGQRH